MDPVHVIGGGLAGSEAAWQVGHAGVPVVLHEMRPARRTEAHVGTGLAELVCSNSFRSDDAQRNAVGVLHEEMRQCGSLILHAADRHKVPAGGALAVDRFGFSEAVEAALMAEPLVEIRREEIAGLPPEEWDEIIVATGPLTSPALAEVRGPVATMISSHSSGGSPAISSRRISTSGSAMSAASTASENPNRSTASAPPAGTLCRSAACRISEPHCRISSCK